MCEAQVILSRGSTKKGPVEGEGQTSQQQWKFRASVEGCGSPEAREVREGFLEEVPGSPGQGWREFQRTLRKGT